VITTLLALTLLSSPEAEPKHEKRSKALPLTATIIGGAADDRARSAGTAFYILFGLTAAGFGTATFTW
jgi:hypothetical protein